MRLDEVRALKACPQRHEKLVAERAQACLDLRGIALYLEENQDQALLQALDDICEGKSLVGSVD